MRMNIKIVFEMGKSAPKWITRFSAKVNTATMTMMAMMMTISRLRRLRSSYVSLAESMMFLFIALVCKDYLLIFARVGAFI